jgi:flagellar hook-associated protein 2
MQNGVTADARALGKPIRGGGLEASGMGRISTGIGLISGINSAQIIDQLMQLEARPKTLIQARIDQTNQQKLAYTDISTRLTSLKLSATTLKKTSTFSAANAASSNEDVLTASAGPAAALGSYQFQVARLVTSQQGVSAGFAGTDSKVGAGTITIEMGGGEVYSQTSLAQLNGGTGVRRGVFRITDRSGKSAVIDISSAFSLDDVVKKINTSLDVSVKASVQDNHLVLTDLTGQTVSNLSVTDLGGGFAAKDLGLVGSVAANTLTGTDINFLSRSTALADLNDGMGVRQSSTGNDLTITVNDGTVVNVEISSVTSVGQVIDAINTAGAGKLLAEVDVGGKGLRITDLSGGAPPPFGSGLTVASAAGSSAARDLGIEFSATSGSIVGNPLIAEINTVLIQSLRGGTGMSLGTIAITDRAGASANVDLSGAQTLADVIDLINAAGAAVTAKVKDSGNGIQLVDESGATGTLVISDVSGTSAAEFGINGTFDIASSSVKGANLQRRWVNENTTLSTFNGGRGVSAGSFKITNSNKVSFTVKLTEAELTNLGAVIKKINDANGGVTASVNANGDGLLLTDTAGGINNVVVANVEGRTATDLNIVGDALASIDGSFEKTYSVTATDTLDDVLNAINLPGFGAAATVINDGSAVAPYRLSLSARNTGRAGRFIFDAGTTALQTANLVEAQDAAVFYGASGSSQQPLVITSSKNQLSGVIKGVTIDLHGVSSSPVTVNVTQNLETAVTEVKKLVETFNAITSKIKEFTSYDTETEKRGVLLGDGTVQRVEAQLYSVVQTVNTDVGAYRTFSEIGVRVGAGSTLELDEEKFRTAYANDPESVKKFFTLFEKGSGTTPDKKGFGTLIEERITNLNDPVSGLITRQNKSLDEKAEQFKDRIETLDKLLEAKRLRLERQFANMETVLAGLQQQQQALAGFQGVQPMRSSGSR